MTLAVATILGGLPVVVDINYGYDSFNGEHWAEVDAIYWLKKGDKPGKEIPQSVRDRAEKYDPYFSNVIEMATEYLAQHNAPEYEKPPFQLIGYRS